MDCSVVRILIRRGALPGTGPGRVPQLGFHLAGCAECRAYASTFEFAPAAPSVSPLAARSLPGGMDPPARSELRAISSIDPALPPSPASSAHRRFAQTVAGALLLVALFFAWYLGVPVVRALADIAAMTASGGAAAGGASPTASSTPVPVMVEALPSSIPTPSSPPAPSSTPLAPTPEPLPAPPPQGVVVGMEVDIPTSEFDKDPTASPSPLPTATASATASAAPTLPPPPTAIPSPTPQVASAPGQGTTLLLLGIDARPGEGWVARSDAIMVVRLDPPANRIAMLSLPRDLWVAIPGAGEAKINNAYFWGEQAGQGLALAKQTVGDSLGIPIDHAVAIDFNGFRGLIDTLGGVAVEVPQELYDPQFPTIDYGYTVAHFSPGPQMLDGDQALTFSRIRHPDSDFARMRRQQQVMLAIAQRFRDRGALQTLHEADQLTAALRPFVRSDIPAPLALNLLWSMRSIDPAQVERYILDLSALSEANIGGAYALIAGDGVLKALGAQLITAH